MFHTLHLMFMDLYNEQWLAVDLVAERIRTLGLPAPGGYKEFAALTAIKDSNGVPAGQEDDPPVDRRPGDSGAYHPGGVSGGGKSR